MTELPCLLGSGGGVGWAGGKGVYIEKILEERARLQWRLCWRVCEETGLLMAGDPGSGMG